MHREFLAMLNYVFFFGYLEWKLGSPQRLRSEWDSAVTRDEKYAMRAWPFTASAEHIRGDGVAVALLRMMITRVERSAQQTKLSIKYFGWPLSGRREKHTVAGRPQAMCQ